MMGEERFSETERNCYYTSLIFDNQTQEELGTDKVVVLLNKQQGIIEEKNKVIQVMGAFIKSKGFSVNDFDEWISKGWHNVDDKWRKFE